MSIATIIISSSIEQLQNGLINISNSHACPFFNVTICGSTLIEYLSFSCLVVICIFTLPLLLDPTPNNSLVSSLIGISSISSSNFNICLFETIGRSPNVFWKSRKNYIFRQTNHFLL